MSMTAATTTGGTEPCWSCTHPIGDGYRVSIFLTPGNHHVLDSYWCWPCFKVVNTAFGEQGKGVTAGPPGGEPDGVGQGAE